MSRLAGLAAATKAVNPYGWFRADSLRGSVALAADREYIAAVSPDVVLAMDRVVEMARAYYTFIDGGDDNDGQWLRLLNELGSALAALDKLETP